MMLSSILDIGSFFIGMIINLLLVTLMCYYFKKKYESLEEAQNEQAKLLYELLRDKNAKPSNDKNDIDINFKIMEEEVDVSDSDSDSDSEMEVFEMESEPPEGPEVKVVKVEIPKPESKSEAKAEPAETKTEPTETNEIEPVEELIIEENHSEDGFSKMSMKQLRDILTEKGVKVKPSMKKNELVELAKL